MIAARRRAAVAALGMALAIAGCKPGDRGAQGGATAPAAPAATATPVEAPPPAAKSIGSGRAMLGDFAGKYPFDSVDGTTFLSHPAVVAAVDRLVPDAGIRKLALGGDGPGAPIALRGGKLVAWGCETHDCGNHDWTIEIAPDGSAPMVCYHDAATMTARSRWYVAPGRTEMRPGDCPSR